MHAAKDAPRDLSYELGLLKKIGRVTVGGVPLTSVPLFGSYALWHRFVQYVFSSDIRRFHAAGSFEGYLSGEGGGKRRSVKGFILGLCSAFVSYVSLLIFALTRPQVLIFAIDRVSDRKLAADFRSAPLYRYLSEKGISYAECLHTVFGKQFFKNFFTRGRFVFYLEALDALYSVARFFGLTPTASKPVLGNLEGFSEEETKFVRYVITKYLGQVGAVTFRVNALRAVLSLSGVKAVWAIDDARHYHDIMLAASLEKIPTCALQHGHFTPYHVGWLSDETPSTLSYIRPDTLIVWSDYWKQELLRLKSVFPESSLMVGGYPYSLPVLPEKKSEELTVLLVHETDSPKEPVSDAIRALSEAGVGVVIKLRPDYSKEEQLSVYGELPRLKAVTRLTELAERPGAVLGVYSTFLYEAVDLGIPVGILDVGMDYGRGMLENGLAEKIPLSGIGSAVRTLSETSESILMARKKKIAPGSLAVALDESLARCGMSPLKRVG